MNHSKKIKENHLKIYCRRISCKEKHVFIGSYNWNLMMMQKDLRNVWKYSQKNVKYIGKLGKLFNGLKGMMYLLF